MIRRIQGSEVDEARKIAEILLLPVTRCRLMGPRRHCTIGFALNDILFGGLKTCCQWSGSRIKIAKVYLALIIKSLLSVMNCHALDLYGMISSSWGGHCGSHLARRLNHRRVTRGRSTSNAISDGLVDVVIATVDCICVILTGLGKIMSRTPDP